MLLQAADITKERLASFDRPIVSEPKFSEGQCPGLKRDLTAYLQTLKASSLFSLYSCFSLSRCSAKRCARARQNYMAVVVTITFLSSVIIIMSFRAIH